MTHPNREELAGRKNLMLALHQWVRDDTNTALKMVVTPAMLEKLAERIADVPATMTEDVRDRLSAGAIQRIAEGVDRLYRGSKE